RITLGLMVVQDLALIPMVALLPVLEGKSDRLLETLGMSLGIAAVALVLVFVLGTRLVPRVFDIVARTESRELFLMTVVIIALGTAAAVERAGLSIALGAFLAGLVVSESDFDRHVLSEIAPLRDLFSTVFFVAIGMLLVPAEIVENWHIVLLSMVVLIVGKTLITSGALLSGGADFRAAILSATVVAQMGEFSFVLAGESLADGIITDSQYGLVLAVAVGSIIATPFVARASPPLIHMAGQLPGIDSRDSDLREENLPAAPLSHHAIICGYGRVGAVLGDALQKRGFKYSVIELNPGIVRWLRDRDIPAFYGDAGSDHLLIHAGIASARALILTTPDLISAPAAIRHARRLNPDIAIITRAPTSGDIDILRQAGATEIIQPEFEAGMECVRYALREFGVSMRETTAIIGRKRTIFYSGDDTESGFSEPDGGLTDEFTVR
ncbi:MAG: cation:proton antiporter, partial [Thermomicrobiales bacterium]